MGGKDLAKLIGAIDDLKRLVAAVESLNARLDQLAPFLRMPSDPRYKPSPYPKAKETND